MFEKFWANSPKFNEKKNDVKKFFYKVLQCVKLKKNG